MVRVPLAPCLAFGSRSKLEGEIATMQYGCSIFIIIEAILIHFDLQASY